MLSGIADSCTEEWSLALTWQERSKRKRQEFVDWEMKSGQKGVARRIRKPKIGPKSGVGKT